MACLHISAKTNQKLVCWTPLSANRTLNRTLIRTQNRTSGRPLKEAFLCIILQWTLLVYHNKLLACIPHSLFLESLGENRGVVATRLLAEMNHEVRGDAVEESPENILGTKQDFFKSFREDGSLHLKQETIIS
jgi:hypothetical protein